MLRMDDDDDDFVLPQASSRLASLFSQENQSTTDESFKYKAPKDPNAPKKAKSPPKTTLLCAYSGHCFKLVSGQYSESQKLGVAIIGEVHNNLYSILLYITKDKPISFTRITPATLVEVGSRNFVSFTDDAHQFWSVGFEREEEVVGFTKQVGLARWMSGDGSKVMRQDLFKGEGCAVDVGDLVEAKVKRFHLATEGVLILDPVREESVKFKVGKKSIPQIWEDTVVGMSRLGRRLVIYVSGDLQMSKESGDKSHGIIAEEIAIVRAKLTKGRETPKTDESINNKETGNVVGESESYHLTTQAHLEEIQSNSKSWPTTSDRTMLMNRIKKLGQPMLPLPGVMTQEDPDRTDRNSRPSSSRGTSRPSPECFDDKEEFVISQMLIKPEIRPKPSPMSKVILDPRAQALPFQDYQIQGPISSFSPFLSSSAMPQIHPDPSMALLMVEMKQQGLDLKSLLMRMYDKIDVMSSKVDELQRTSLPNPPPPSQVFPIQPPTSTTQFFSPLLQYEVDTITESIEKIFKDNEVLRKEVKEREMKIGKLTQKMNELSGDNHKLVQKGSTEVASSNAAATLLSDENASLKNALEELKEELSQSRQDRSIAQQLLQARSQEAKDLREQLDRSQATLSSVQGEIESEVNDLRSRLERETERLKKLVEEKEHQLKTEREERVNLEQEKKMKIIESDRIISDLRETLMKRNMTESDSKVILKEKGEELVERMKAQEELQRSLMESWEKEKVGLKRNLSELEKLHEVKLKEVLSNKNAELQAVKEELKKCSHQLSESEKLHEVRLKEVLSNKNAELQAVREELKRCSQQLSDVNKQHQAKLKEAICQKSTESQVVRNELNKLSQEYITIKALAKDLKEKYDWLLVQHNNNMEQNNFKIKTLMNSIYKCFKESFMPETSYSGVQVLGCSSKIIKTKTLEALSSNCNQNNDNDISAPSPSLSSTSQGIYSPEGNGSKGKDISPRVSLLSSALLSSDTDVLKGRNDIAGTALSSPKNAVNSSQVKISEIKVEELNQNTNAQNHGDQTCVLENHSGIDLETDHRSPEWCPSESSTKESESLERLAKNYKVTQGEVHQRAPSGKDFHRQNTPLLSRDADLSSKDGNLATGLTNENEGFKIRDLPKEICKSDNIPDESKRKDGEKGSENDQALTSIPNNNMEQNQSQEKHQEETKLESGFSSSNQFESKSTDISNDDDSPAKPPPFPDSDAEEDDWSY